MIETLDDFLFTFRTGLRGALTLLLPGNPCGPDPRPSPQGAAETSSLDNNVASRAVYMVASPLSFTAPQRVFAGYPGGALFFAMLTGINTMHWGLRIGEDLFVDLKHLPSGKIGFEFASNSDRDENETLQQVYLGVTHFNDNEAMTLLARHRVNDHDFKDYLLVYYNCQTFALNMLATDILCPVCKGPSNAYYSYLTLALIVRRYLSLLLSVPAYMYYWILLAQWMWPDNKVVQWHLLLSPLPPILMILSFRGFFQSSDKTHGHQDPGQEPSALAMLRAGINPYLREYPFGGYGGLCAICSQEDLSMLRQLSICSSRNREYVQRIPATPISLLSAALTYPIWCGGELQAIFIIGLLTLGKVYGGLYLLWLALIYVRLIQHPDSDMARTSLHIKTIFYRGPRDAYAMLWFYSIRVWVFTTDPPLPAAYELMYDLAARIWNVQTWPAQIVDVVTCSCYRDCRYLQTWIEKAPHMFFAVMQWLPVTLIRPLKSCSRVLLDLVSPVGPHLCTAVSPIVGYYDRNYPSWMRDHQHWKSDWFWYWVIYVDGILVILYVLLTTWLFIRELKKPCASTSNRPPTGNSGPAMHPSTKIE